MRARPEAAFRFGKFARGPGCRNTWAMTRKVLARLRPAPDSNRRKAVRRAVQPDAILSSFLVFDRQERQTLSAMERRKALRRKEDVRRRVAALQP